MRKILIATHGYLADGIKSAINILCGMKNNITYINAYVDEKNIDEDIKIFFENLGLNEEVVIFTDIIGGSVNQKFIPYCTRPNVYLISGFNLAIILEIVLKEEILSENYIKELVNNCRKQLAYISEKDLKIKKDEEFF